MPKDPSQPRPPIKLPAVRPDGTKRRRPSLTPAQRQAHAAAYLADMDRRGIRPIKVGRPRSYTPDCCDIAMRVGSKGGSNAEIAAALGCERVTLDDWRRDYSEFNSAMHRARDLAQAWWETHGRKSLATKHYQANVWAKSMSARFPEYRESKQQSVGELAVDLLQAIEEVARKMSGDGAKVIEGAVVSPECPPEADDKLKP